jgi:hypothetical protein
VIALAGGVLVALLVVLLVSGRRDDASSALPDRVRIEHVPVSYRVTYEVVAAAGTDGTTTTTTEVLEGERPFR